MSLETAPTAPTAPTEPTEPTEPTQAAPSLPADATGDTTGNGVAGVGDHLARRLRWRGAGRPWLVAVPLLAAVVSWATALPGLRAAPVSQWGLLVAGPPQFVVALVLVHLAALAAVRRGSAGLVLVCAVMLVAVQRLTTTLVTDVPIYSWTYKHLGVVDYIAGSGQLARGVDVYNGWPGLFAATAWASGVAGLDPMVLAHAVTPLLHLAYLGAVVVLARAWGLTRMSAAVAAFLVESFNWVGQDYFAPQAVTFLLAVVLLALLGNARQHRWLLAPALVVYGAAVVTHQLTPYWLLGLVLLLVLTRQVRAWWLPLAMATMVVGFSLSNSQVLQHFTLFSADVIGNAQSNISTVGVLGQRVTSGVVRGLSVAMWVAAFVAAVVDWRRGRDVVGRALIAFSPFAVLLGQGYGGEAIFRVFLYSLPGCCLLLAPYLVDALQAGWRRIASATTTVVVLGTASAQGYFGGWSANLMTRDQVDFSTQLLNQVEWPAYLTVAAPVWPERPTGRYVQFAEFKVGYDYPMVYAADLVGASFASDEDYQTFTETIAGRTGGPTYLILSQQMRVYDWYFGILPPEALDNLEERIDDDPRWTKVLVTGQYSVYRTAGADALPGAGMVADQSRFAAGPR